MPDDPTAIPDDPGHAAFTLLIEAGIIAQLTRALLEAKNPDGLSLPQFGVLSHLVRLGGAWSPLRLARAFQQPKTTMTHTIATLEKRGLIAMAPNPEDGRSKLVTLTEAGRAAHGRAVTSLTDDMIRLSGDVGAARIAAALPLLTDLRRHLDRYRDTDEPATG
ncbi:hypothetical protein DEA8626_03159 [Defluviimonas aquaemixtae]|uniref:HTH marR-type domain-containing protein n=1 Tax=Albidovulum aquaemixtae TaxID=1542388 RepID=A0A2R8BL03_9RHOB|nr:MarR family transcriptional regulator [Defluviimonas aquaemixtae]SPH24110.1 hypothetical protein DEA8626_03159 [Defluviimonas aquaemixtae]